MTATTLDAYLQFNVSGQTLIQIACGYL